MLEAIAAANDFLSANAKVTILSRDPGRFAAQAPHLAARREFFWLTGDAADFPFPANGFDFVMHFATASAAEVGAGGTATMEHCLRGTNRVIRFAGLAGSKRLLFASSGAVYGRQPAGLAGLAENFKADEATLTPYGRLKRMEEAMLLGSPIDCVVTRGFSFIGPYLPFSDKFAAGSFLRDALSAGPIRINSDGSSTRSYLYAADLAAWLLTMLARGRSGASYNVGSDEPTSLSALARSMAAETGAAGIEYAAQCPSPASLHYVPDISLARNELGLAPWTGLAEGVKRTIRWARQAPSRADDSKCP